MRKIRFSIGNKIFGGFLVLIILFVINAATIFYNGNKIDEVVNKSSNVIRPSQEIVNDFILLVTRSKMLIINWVYVQSNTDDKEALKDLHNFEYPQLKDNLNELATYWESDSQKHALDSVFVEFEKLLAIEQDIMSQLVTFENYEDPLTKLLAEDAIESQVIPMTTVIIDQLNEVARMQEDVTQESDQELMAATRTLRNITIILGLVTVVIGVVFAYFMARSMTKPINYIKNLLLKLGKGELVDDQGKRFNNDEIGEMAVAMENLIQGLRSTTNFAENIGKGSYDSEFEPLSEEDVLGNALIEMRSNLARVAEEDKKRNWSTEGLAKFGDILRSNNDNLEKLSDNIIRNLVKYLEANQGGLYIIEDREEEDPFMTLAACYAWDKKKYVDQKIYKGEGVAGQVWQEMDKVYITDVPNDYIKITSGLGDANPKSILIVPLKVNEEIYGVVEIASFKEFEEHEIEFVEKIAENIASTVSSVKINAKTQKLLTESQQMTEQMRSQEEEMRQNMEELQATQEEMQRGQAEAENTMEAINDAVAVIEFNTEGVIENANRNFMELMGYTKDEIVGEHHRMFVSREERTSDDYKQLWRELAAGTPKRGEFKRITKSGDVIYLAGNYTIVRGRDGGISKIMKFAFDITKYVEVEDLKGS
ncbi:MAG: GAF domain-containing protein [Cytophagales bacterium]|nr:GAF domain-containing protein [Cytophagales bacterium]